MYEYSMAELFTIFTTENKRASLRPLHVNYKLLLYIKNNLFNLLLQLYNIMCLNNKLKNF